MTDASTESVVRIQPAPVTIHVGDSTLEALEITLGGVPRGVVVVLGEGAGSAHETIEIMNRFAEHGYESLAVEAGGDVGVAHALLERTGARGWELEQCAVVGIGEGGRTALEIAGEKVLGAAVSLSATAAGGSASPVPAVPLDQVVRAVRTPWLGLFGDLDPTVGPEVTGALEAALRVGSDVFTQLVRYPGVSADFHRRWTHGLEYAASYDGWQRVQEWLDARVAPRLTPLAIAWREQRSRA